MIKVVTSVDEADGGLATGDVGVARVVDTARFNLRFRGVGSDGWSAWNEESLEGKSRETHRSFLNSEALTTPG